MTETHAGQTRAGAAKPLAALLAIACALPEAQAAGSSRQAAIALVRQVQRADYEGDRAALKRLHADLAPPRALAAGPALEEAEPFLARLEGLAAAGCRLLSHPDAVALDALAFDCARGGGA